MLHYKIFIGAILTVTGLSQLLAGLTGQTCTSAGCQSGPYLVCCLLILGAGIHLLIRGIRDQQQ